MATAPRAPRTVPAALMAELAQRVDAHLSQIELDPAEAAAREMLALAERSGSAAYRAQALCALAHVQTRQEALTEAVQTAAAALQAARKARRRDLVALALLRQAVAGQSLDPTAAAARAEEAAQQFQALDDDALEGQALRLLAAVRLAQADTPEHRAIAHRAVNLLHESGDKAQEGRARMTLSGGEPDLALRLRGLKQALQLAIEAGDREFEAGARHNLAMTYNLLGLHRRALLLMQQSMALRERGIQPAALLNSGVICAHLQASLGEREAHKHTMAGVEAAWQRLARLAALPKPTLDKDMATRHPLRILLAEDTVVNQKLAMRLLSQLGYRADLAANGIEAIDALQRQTYDVVLMDVQMPEMDGLEASRRITAKWPSTQRPRIVAMTANAMQGDREECLAAGMDDYVTKPIRVDALVQALIDVPARKDV